ncbi:MAG: hypothetical protein LBU92_01330 [Prevotellaceae bacterium]|jgi:hypothetical protein|nr:hypothetical protein [Prevotellaceae bacterium]
MTTITVDTRSKSSLAFLNYCQTLPFVKMQEDGERRKKLKRAQLKEALSEASDMAADIVINGTNGYKTLDDLLAE